MDTQIWYAIFSTICGGVNGAFSRLGEVGSWRRVYPLSADILYLLILYLQIIYHEDPNPWDVKIKI
jgi:hypothetical protein